MADFTLETLLNTPAPGEFDTRRVPVPEGIYPAVIEDPGDLNVRVSKGERASVMLDIN